MKFKLGTFKKLLLDYLLIKTHDTFQPILWRDKFSMFYVRYERGYGLIQFIIRPLMFIGIAGIMVGIDLSFIPKWLLGLFVVVWIVGFYSIGFIDIIFGFLKNQNKYSTEKLNPTFEEMKNDIGEIKNLLNKKNEL